MKQIRDTASLLWRFRYHLLCTLVAVALWDTHFIYPFRLFMVVVHEVCHAAAAIATGGEVLEMKTQWDESGHTLTRGGLFPINVPRLVFREKPAYATFLWVCKVFCV